MKLFVVLTVLGVALAASHESLYTDATISAWAEWRTEHGVSYDTPQEESHRFEVFADHLATINAHNAAGKSWTMGLSKWSDLTFAEFKAEHGILDDPQHCSATNGPMKKPVSLKAPGRGKMEVDWRAEGVVTHVKDQGHCGSCWTFSSTGALESHHAINSGELLNLSEQQLVDCAQGFNNNGCRGGLPSQAFEYLAWTGGIQTERTYKYHGMDLECKFDASKVALKVAQSYNITSGDEDELIEKLTEVGPISIAYCVQSDFMHYTGGIYSSDDCPQGTDTVNHAVLAVGYGHCDKEDMDFYLVKNSWSRHWGMDGYFKIEAHKNMCGLAVCASYPILDEE